MRRRSEGTARCTRRAAAVTVAAVLALAGACSGDDGAADDGSTTTEAPPPSLAPPGTPIGDSGLVVPDGAHLAGPAFGGGRLEEPGWGALVTVDEDPFAVTDALSGQLRDLGLPMPGTGASCEWSLEPGPDRPLQVPVASGDPGAPVQLLVCGATAWAGPDQDEGRPTRATLRLIWGGDATGAIWVDWSTAPSDRARGAYGDASGFAPRPGGPPTGEEPTPAPPGPAPVPSDARDRLPPRDAPAPDPEPGDAFGGQSNCHSDADERFDLPPGSRLVGTQGGPDGHSVVAVEDVQAAMDALVAHAAGSTAFTSEEATTTAPDGQRVALRSMAIQAGGGVCELLESPDGTHVLISGHSD